MAKDRQCESCGHEHHVDKRSGGHGEEPRTWTRWWTINRFAAPRCQHDPIRCTAQFSARHEMAEFVQRNDAENRQIEGDNPPARLEVSEWMKLHLDNGDEEPRPVNHDINAENAKQSQGTALNQCHNTSDFPPMAASVYEPRPQGSGAIPAPLRSRFVSYHRPSRR